MIDEDVENDNTHIMDTCTKCHALFYQLVLYTSPIVCWPAASGVVKKELPLGCTARGCVLYRAAPARRVLVYKH